MWDTAEVAKTYISHDMPCPGCAHARHTYLSCSDECACVPSWPGMPVSQTRGVVMVVETPEELLVA